MRRLAYLVILGVGLIIACDYKPKEEVYIPRLPFPDNETSIYLQSRVDSLEYEWFTDVKAVSQIFCNDEVLVTKQIDTGDIVVIGEGLFHAKSEAHLPDKVLILTLERAFKSRGKNSVWQVIKMEEKPGGPKPGQSS